MIKLFTRNNIIKIKGKTFENLSMDEFALMIDADSALSEKGNDFFSSCALDEFLHNFDPEREDLKELQSLILRNIYIDCGGYKEINVDFLRDLSSKLKNKN